MLAINDRCRFQGLLEDLAEMSARRMNIREDSVDIRVVARHGQIPADVQETISRKVAKLPRIFDRMTAIEVICEMEHSGEPNVEIRISAEERNDFFASDKASNVIAAVDKVIGKIESQMRKHKEKITGHRGRDNRLSELVNDESE